MEAVFHAFSGELEDLPGRLLGCKIVHFVVLITEEAEFSSQNRLLNFLPQDLLFLLVEVILGHGEHEGEELDVFCRFDDRIGERMKEEGTACAVPRPKLPSDSGKPCILAVADKNGARTAADDKLAVHALVD